MTLFHEIYSAYYQAAAAVLKESFSKTLTPGKVQQYIQKYAFGESMLVIPEGLHGEKWRLLHKDLTPALRKEPSMPLTALEKRWLKALLLDPRIRLFDPDTAGLEDAEPLFTPDDFVYYERYSNGDPYGDPEYISHFRAVLRSLREEENLSISFLSRHGISREAEITPHYLEYSEKEDRFRLIASDRDLRHTINIARITRCEPVRNGDYYPYRPAEMAEVTFELEDTRSAMERVMLHFSHLQKETKRLDDTHYRVTLRYDRHDETEMVIRILSFGPFIRVTGPESFIDLIRQRIRKQKDIRSQSG